MKRLRSMLMNRCRLLMFAPFLVAVTAVLFGGIGLANAGREPSEIKNSHDYYKIRDPKVNPKLHPKERARVQREAAIKNRENSRKLVRNIMEGKETGGGAK